LLPLELLGLAVRPLPLFLLLETSLLASFLLTILGLLRFPLLVGLELLLALSLGLLPCPFVFLGLPLGLLLLALLLGLPFRFFGFPTFF
jgi:hypothetical protein